MTPEEALKHIFITYGRSLLQEPKRVKNLLNDLCPRLEPSNKREMHALVLVMDENIPSELVACTAIDEVRLRRLVQRLLDASFIPEDVALKAIHIWGHALGLALPTLAPQSAIATPSNSAEKAAVPGHGKTVNKGTAKSMGFMGIGFITPEGGGKDLIVFKSDIKGYTTLRQGQKVEYEAGSGSGETWLRAYKVVPIK